MPSPVGVAGRGVGGLDFVLGVRGRGFSLHDSPLLALVLCDKLGRSFEALENLYGVHVIGRSLNFPSKWTSNGSLVVAICAKNAHAVKRLMIENAAPALCALHVPSICQALRNGELERQTGCRAAMIMFHPLLINHSIASAIESLVATYTGRRTAEKAF